MALHSCRHPASKPISYHHICNSDGTAQLGKSHRITCHEDVKRGSINIPILILNFSVRRGRVVKATPRPLCLREGEPVPLIQEARRATKAVWTGAENLSPTGIRSTDRAALTDCAFSPQVLCGRRGNIAELHGRT